MTNVSTAKEYNYHSAAAGQTEAYLWPKVRAILDVERRSRNAVRAFDLGCGNGALAADLQSRGFAVTGIDSSTSGIHQARQAWPDLDVHEGSAYDDLASRFGRFPIVVSLEVVEHVYAPRTYAATLYDLVTPGGLAIVSTPFHGYWKNLVMALGGELDGHFTALWDHGHIKFWSMKTLRSLLAEAGFEDISFEFAGRFYPLSKSMIAVARKSENASLL